MDRSEQELVTRRVEYEQTLIRHAEQNLRVHQAAYLHTRGELEGRGKAFEAVRTKILRLMGQSREGDLTSLVTTKDIRWSLERAKTLAAQAHAAASLKRLAGEELKGSLAQVQGAIQKKNIHQARGEKLEELAHQLGKREVLQKRTTEEESFATLRALRAAQVSDAAQCNVQCNVSRDGGIEIGAASNLNSPMVTQAAARTDDGVPPLVAGQVELNGSPSTFDSNAQSRIAALAGGDLAASQNNSDNRGARGQTQDSERADGFGSTDSLRERKGSEPRSAADRLRLELREAGYGSAIQAGDFASQISELTSRDHGEGSQIQFSFTGESGHTVQVQLTGQPSGEIAVSVAPGSLADQRVLTRALHKLKQSLNDRGLKVDKFAVGGVSGN